MAESSERFIGARIAELRKRRGLTQQGLAMRANISMSLLSKVEVGQKPASPEFVAACARALSVPPADLLGQPYLNELRKDHTDRVIQPIREVLNFHNLGHDPVVRPRSLEELSAERDRICQPIQATDNRTAAVDLPALMSEVIAIAHESDESRAWAVLVMLDWVAYSIASRYGFHDLSVIAVNRAEYAAARSGDPMLSAMVKYLAATACMRAGEFRTGLRFRALGEGDLEYAEVGLEREATLGQIHLIAGLLEARTGNAEAAEEHFRDASSLAVRTGEAIPARWLGSTAFEEPSRGAIGHRDRGIHWFAFGPTNLAAYRIAAFADRNQHAEALKVGESLNVSDQWPSNRMAYVHMDMARSYLWTGRNEEAFDRLLKAQKNAPEQTRFHPQVREVIVQLRKRERSRGGSVAHFAQWVGV
ncbi:helix-turn-helix domain-containing protein [Streptomyces sp. NPDC057638]|uniref:helix-turn-helix domain-containing protein n=1 Tax=Streptomyces sp. NPDC057638 TaxID=3346190 RepID=UPI0036B737AC